ncbi:MAG: type II toxin-antitoxin system HipA family toxin [Pseudonocardiales bacterium]|nr:MAG: type II toxin-antitoxin system HipA family toxin [Pseudonocardiales bacterium]
MTLREVGHSVWLRSDRVGTLFQRGDYTRFAFSDRYLNDPGRPVLGLLFEQDLSARHAAALRLPCWFSNLLPEGRLREWIAADRKVSPHREMELLAQVGHDLPGAVRVLPAMNDEGDDTDWLPKPPPVSAAQHAGNQDTWRFSLAGVALKFSMLAKGDRLTLPAFGVGGDWIVKLPDQTYPDVPRNEFTMMSLAASAGIDVPPVRLVHRDELDGLPPDVWTSREEWAYAIRRFDRDANRDLVHIEDLAQVRNVYPEGKYLGNYETVAALAHRGHDLDGLREFARRLAFTILIANGDAHLKNWSLVYTDPRVPGLAPAYDMVSTAYYLGERERLGLKFGGTRRFDKVDVTTFERLQRRLRAPQAELAACVAELVERVRLHWPEWRDQLAVNLGLASSIESRIASGSLSLLRQGNDL